VTADGTTGTRAGRKWIGLAVLALVPVLLSVDVSVLFLALPELSADLRPTSLELVWIGDIYPFMIAGFLVTAGILGDRIGRKRLLLIGAALFGAASIATAYSVSPEMLIAARAVLGISGAIMLPNTLTLVVVMFPEARQRSFAIGVWISCFMAGIAIGPLVGGVVLNAFWWGAVFLIGVPVMAVLLILGPFILPEFRNENPGRVDVRSIVLSLATIFPIVYALKGFARDGFSLSYLVAMLAGLAFGALFTYRQRILDVPLLNLRLFRNPTFAGGIGIMLLGSANISGTMLLISQYLQEVLGYSPIHAGLWMMAPAAGLVAASSLSPMIARRIRPGYVMGGGLAVAFAGFLVLMQVTGVRGLGLLVAGSALVQAGIGAGGSLGTDLVVGTAPIEQAGAAAALNQTGTELGTALGLGGLGTVAVVVYRGHMAGSPVAGARDTLPGALNVAHTLSASSADALVAQARDAFATGVSTAATISAVVVGALSVAAALLLRRARPTGQAAPASKQAGG
jgi:MFS transporter, DHA2 family, multidrug resistance protein